jgi:hypothetical protein
MAIEAPFSKFAKNNIKTYIVVCVILAVWFAYDGYFSKEFIQKHTDASGMPDSTLVFNKKAPPVFVGVTVLLCCYLMVKSRGKIIADENKLVLRNKKRIPYDSIEKIDKTNFGSKGCFIITYKDEKGNVVNHKLSDRTYDNLAAILDHLVAKIS